MEIEKRLKKIEYHQRLLLEMIQEQRFPVYEIIIKSDLTEGEVEDLFRLCAELSTTYEKQKEEGFVHFGPLLTKFVGLLNHKINPEEIIHAFIKQNMYEPLMTVLKKSIHELHEEN